MANGYPERFSRALEILRQYLLFRTVILKKKKNVGCRGCQSNQMFGTLTQKSLVKQT